MLELKTKKELGQEAHKLAGSFNLVRYRNTAYIPVDYETKDRNAPSPPERTMWLPLTRDDIRRMAAAQFDTLFSSEADLSSFEFMVAQNSHWVEEMATTLLVRTEDGLRELKGQGVLEEPTGRFIPNTLTPMLVHDEKEKDRVFATIAEWVDSEEEAHSLLHHLATVLAPGWSAVKYVLLLGEGRNGKSLLLKMLRAVLGDENVSGVTRQQISEQSPVVTELNGKLLNLVFDGQAQYVKDSGMEKSLVAGEPAKIRKLYESSATTVQTNALFVEGLNKEPKSSDKSTALQKRLVRYQFPNVYPLDLGFEKLMLSAKSLSAFLSLLLDHYVDESEVAVKLAPSSRAMELQLEHMYSNSLALQFVKHLEENDTLGVDSILGSSITDLAQRFQSWRLQENDLSTWAEPDVLSLFQPIVNTERRSARVNGQPRKVRVVTTLKPEGQAFIESLKGADEDEELAALVAD